MLFKNLVRAATRDGVRPAQKVKSMNTRKNPRARTFRARSRPAILCDQIEKIEAKTMRAVGNHRLWYLALYYDLQRGIVTRLDRAANRREFGTCARAGLRCMLQAHGEHHRA